MQEFGELVARVVLGRRLLAYASLYPPLHVVKALAEVGGVDDELYASEIFRVASEQYVVKFHVVAVQVRLRRVQGFKFGC